MAEFSRRPDKINWHALAVVTRSKNSDESGRPRLLQQQIAALEGVIHNSPEFEQRHIVLISMPTGTGKTGVIACLPYYLGSLKVPGSDEPRYRFDKPILVIAPNLAILDQLKQELTVMDTSRQPFLIRTNIVPEDWHADVLPKPLIVERTSDIRNQLHLETAEIVIANAQKFLAADWENHLDDDLFRLVIVDEAHHHPATTWRRIVEKFRSPDCPVFFFTATPYRGDGEKVLPPETSCIAYHLSLTEAVQGGMIRQTQFEELTELEELRAQQTETFPPQVKTDIKRMIPILRKVEQLLDDKRLSARNVPHMAIVIARDTYYADLLLELWKVRFPDKPAESYHSNSPSRDEIMRKLKNNELSLVIVVGMLLEGFDHPPISIAAITCKIDSPVKFVQFVGRAQRIYRRDGYTDEMTAEIVTHKDYKQRKNYEDFRKETLIPKDHE